MKRFGAILSLALIMVMMCSSLCFADNFQLNNTYPADGDTGKSIDNFGIKLYFNQPVLNEENVKHNAKCIKVVGEDGKQLPVTLYYSPKEEGLAMALVEPENKDLVQQNCLYTVTLSGDFLDAAGDELGEDAVISFTTLNQTRASTVNMVMMVIMFGGMFFFSSRAMKKQAEEKPVKKGDDKVNPYKEAKKSGKSIEDIVEQDKKNKAKKAAHEARRVARDQADREAARKKMEKEGLLPKEDVVEKNPNKKVKGPRPISAGGSTYSTGRKAAAEAARAKGTTNPKNKSSKKNRK